MVGLQILLNSSIWLSMMALLLTVFVILNCSCILSINTYQYNIVKFKNKIKLRNNNNNKKRIKKGICHQDSYNPRMFHQDAYNQKQITAVLMTWINWNPPTLQKQFSSFSKVEHRVTMLPTIPLRYIHNRKKCMST